MVYAILDKKYKQKLTHCESRIFEDSYEQLKTMCAAIATNITRDIT